MADLKRELSGPLHKTGAFASRRPGQILADPLRPRAEFPRHGYIQAEAIETPPYALILKR